MSVKNLRYASHISYFRLMTFDQTVAGENKRCKIGIIYIFSWHFVQHKLLFIFYVLFKTSLVNAYCKIVSLEMVQSEYLVMHGLTRNHDNLRCKSIRKCCFPKKNIYIPMFIILTKIASRSDIYSSYNICVLKIDLPPRCCLSEISVTTATIFPV